MEEISNTTNNMLYVVKQKGLIKIKRNNDKKDNRLDKVFEDFKNLANQKLVRVYESTSDPYEMIVVSVDHSFKDFFIV